MRKSEKFELFFFSFSILIVSFFGCFFSFLLFRFNKPSNVPVELNAVDNSIVFDSVPKMYLSLNNILLSEVNSGEKSMKYSGNSVNFVTGDNFFSFDNVEVKGHGNTTWDQEKKPYQIKFQDKVDLFGLGKSKKWILLANYLDSSNMRNDIGLYIARLLGLKYTTNGQFIDLFVNGDYVGMYYLVPRVEISKASANLKDRHGILIELENCHYNDGILSYSYFGNKFFVSDSVSEDENDITIARADFFEDFNAFEIALEARDWEQINKYIDIDSFVRYYILEDFISNRDAYLTSVYFYKDGFDDKIHVGPVWDFDIGFGYTPDNLLYPKWEAYVQFENLSGNIFLGSARDFFDLAEMPEFQELAKEVVLSDILPFENEIIVRIDDNSDKINDSANKNAEAWNLDDFHNSVAKLKKFITDKMDRYMAFYGSRYGFIDGIYRIPELGGDCIIAEMNDGGFLIQRLNDKLVLTADEKYEIGATVYFSEQNNSKWQRWYLSKNEDGTFSVFSKALELVLDIDGNVWNLCQYEKDSNSQKLVIK